MDSFVLLSFTQVKNLFSFLALAYSIGFYSFTKEVKVKTGNLPTMNAMSVCLRVYTMGKRRTMYLMSYATSNNKAEKFVFFKSASRLGVRVNRGKAW